MNPRAFVNSMMTWGALAWVACSQNAAGVMSNPSTAGTAAVPIAGVAGTSVGAGVAGTLGSAGAPAAANGGSSGVGSAGIAAASAGVGANPFSAGNGSGGGAAPAANGGTGGGGGGTPMSEGGAGGSNDAGASGSSGPAATCPATATLKPGETTEMIMVSGVARSYILHVPQSYTGSTPVPLVVDWHPILTNDTFERGNSGYLALSDQNGFIVAYPSGIDNAWNIGPCCTTSRTVDDLGFAKAVVSAIEAKGCVDPKRVYAAGFSMGGGMSHYLACNAADVFAAVVPSAFDLLNEDEEPCHPARPISELSFRDTGDPIVPYAGGASMPPNGLAVTIHFLGAVATFQKWAMLDGCTDMPMDIGSGCQTHTQCKDGVEVTLCTKQGGTHETGDSVRGWNFMKAHPLP